MEKICKQYQQCPRCYIKYVNDFLIEENKGKKELKPKSNPLFVCPVCRAVLKEDEKRKNNNPEFAIPDGLSFDVFSDVVVLPTVEKDTMPPTIKKEFLLCPVCKKKFANEFEVREINNPSVFSGGILTINKSNFEAVAKNPTTTCPDCFVYLIDDKKTAEANPDIALTDEIMREMSGIKDYFGFFSKTDKKQRDKNTAAELKQARANKKEGLLDRPFALKNKKLQNICDEVNELLKANGFSERYIANNEDQKIDEEREGPRENIALYSPDKSKKIVFYDDKAEGWMYYLGMEKHIDYHHSRPDIEEYEKPETIEKLMKGLPEQTYAGLMKDIYTTTKNILTNVYASVTMTEKIKNGHTERVYGNIFDGSTINMLGVSIKDIIKKGFNKSDFLNPDFSREEKILREKRDLLKFECWSGEVPHDIKLKLLKGCKFF